MLAGACGFGLKVGFKGWIFFFFFVLVCTGMFYCSVHFVLPSLPVTGVRGGLGLGCGILHIQGLSPPAQDLCRIPSCFLRELNRWSLTQHTKHLQPLSSDCRMPHKR